MAPRIPSSSAFLCSFRAEAEGAEHQQEDEEIIDAQGELDQVAGGKFEPCLVTLNMTDPNAETRGEDQQKQDKKKIAAGLGGRLPSTKNRQVEHDQHQHHDVETYPVS